MSGSIEGSCGCGAVTVKSDAEPKGLNVCHCRDCQKFSGSAFGTNLFVPTDSLSVTGEVKTYAMKADSGHDMVRTFCPTCSVVVSLAPMVVPHVVALPVGILEDRDLGGPKMELYTDRKYPWVTLEGERQSFAEGPRS